MSNTFSFVGNLKPIKKTERFNPYTKVSFDSGWEIEKFSFSIVCDTNRHVLELQSGKFKDDNKNKVYTFTKNYTDDKGVKHKGEKIEIPFADRLNPENIDRVASFKKFVVDLESPLRRQKIKQAIDKFVEGTITDELMDEIDCHSKEGAEEALVASNAKRQEFIHEYDFLQYVKALINSGAVENKMFRVTGDIEYTYSDSKDIFYRSFIPTKIYFAGDDAEAQSTANMNVFFNETSLDTESFDETGKYYLNAFVRQYANGYKNNTISVPIQLVLDSNGSDEKFKKANLFKKRLTTFNEAPWREVGLHCTVINGAERIEITEDDLTDEQKEDIDCGLTTFEDIKRDLGGTTFGDRVSEIRVENYARGYNKSGAQDTVYTDDDFGKPQREGLEDEDEDIFNTETIDDLDEI